MKNQLALGNKVTMFSNTLFMTESKLEKESMFDFPRGNVKKKEPLALFKFFLVHTDHHLEIVGSDKIIKTSRRRVERQNKKKL